MANDFVNGRKNNKKGYRFLLSLNKEQKLAKAQILQNTISIILGKAGSGKTLLACQIALQEVLEKRCTKIIITRPTISKEDLGFLPGGLEEKMSPWVAPIYGNMHQLLRKERVQQLIANDVIEIVPVSYIDDGQTLMILQRIGLHSRMMFCGDTDQIDLKKQSDTGLQFLSSISNIPGLHTCELLNNHRHPILDDILNVYKK